MRWQLQKHRARRDLCPEWANGRARPNFPPLLSLPGPAGLGCLPASRRAERAGTSSAPWRGLAASSLVRTGRLRAPHPGGCAGSTEAPRQRGAAGPISGMSGSRLAASLGLQMQVTAALRWASERALCRPLLSKEGVLPSELLLVTGSLRTVELGSPGLCGRKWTRPASPCWLGQRAGPGRRAGLGSAPGAPQAGASFIFPYCGKWGGGAP